MKQNKQKRRITREELQQLALANPSHAFILWGPLTDLYNALGLRENWATKVYMGILRFQRRNSGIKWLHFRLHCLSLFVYLLLDLPVNYSGLCNQTLILLQPTSSFIILRFRRSPQLQNTLLGELDCPHQVSLEICQC